MHVHHSKHHASKRWLPWLLAVAIFTLVPVLHGTGLGAQLPHSTTLKQRTASKQQQFLAAPKLCRAPCKNERVPQLELVGSWPGTKNLTGQHVTLATQLSLARLDKLEAQCTAWPHPLVAAVYVPLVRGRIRSPEASEHDGIALSDARRDLKQFHKRMRQQKGACDLRLRLYSERCDSATKAALYPFNAMRNRALDMVQTEAVMQLDVDFLVSKQFSRDLGKPASWAALRQQLELTVAVVLPAFEANPELLRGGEAWNERELRTAANLTQQAVEGNKSWMVRHYKAGQVSQFAGARFPEGHKCTNYRAWAGATDFYSIHYEEGYEPYSVMLRRHVPWHDERFRGYGRDKCVGYLTMWWWGVRFGVHPRAWVVHSPHPDGPAKAVTRELDLHQELKNKFYEVREELAAGSYVPATGFPQQCLLHKQQHKCRRKGRFGFRTGST